MLLDVSRHLALREKLCGSSNYVMDERQTSQILPFTKYEEQPYINDSCGALSSASFISVHTIF